MNDSASGGAALQLSGVSRTYPGSPVPAVSDVSFEVAAGELVSILGPSGCGKTTLLRLIAGFEPADSGSISSGGRTVHDTLRRIAVPPERRSTGFVFQDHVLFPHLNVLNNVMFGLAGRPREERFERAMQMLDLVGMRVFAQRAPQQLSGGQQQRVALARALAPQPAVVLLDEPFSSLDAGLRASTRAEVRDILRTTGTTALLVTHDQEEALGFADRLLLMRAGSIEQHGHPEDVYREPVSAFSALFLGGTNLIRGEAAGRTARTWLGDLELTREATGQVLLSVRPEQLGFRPAGADGRVVVTSRVFHGHDLSFTCVSETGPDQQLSVRTGPEVAVQAGEVLSLTVSGPAVPLEASPRPKLSRSVAEQ